MRCLVIAHKIGKDETSSCLLGFCAALSTDAVTKTAKLNCNDGYQKQSRFDQLRVIPEKPEDPHQDFVRADIALNECGNLSTDNICHKLRKLCRNGRVKESLDIMSIMEERGIEAHIDIFLNLLHACVHQQALSEGRRVHNQILKSGAESSIQVVNMLVNMYCKCGSLVDAWKIFFTTDCQDLFTWTTMITGCVYNGDDEEALQLFWLMLKAGWRPDAVIISYAIKSCAKLNRLEDGKKLYSYAFKLGLGSDIFLQCSLIDLHIKCGDLELARNLFDRSGKQNIIFWSSIIDGYTQYGIAEEALKLFEQMMQYQFKPNEVTLISMLKASAALGMLDQGKLFHSHVVEIAVGTDVLVLSTLVDMYSKCGSLEDSMNIFKIMPSRTLVSWNVMLGAYAQHGKDTEAFELFQEMQQEGLEIDHITFLLLFSVCSHGGLLHAAYEYFKLMLEDHKTLENIEHFMCMADLLSRTGCFNETLKFIDNMPLQPTAACWMVLLSACRMSGDKDFTEQIASHILELEPENFSALMLSSNT